MTLTKRQLEIMQHAMGMDQYGRSSGDRNYFCAGVEDVPICRELVAMGYMREHGRREWLPYFNCSVTRAGRQAVIRQSERPPKLTRSQLRYRRFLNWADAYGGTFREFLAWEKAKKTEALYE